MSRSSRGKRSRRKQPILDFKTAMDKLNKAEREGESDRGLVLVFGAIVDQQLEQLIRMKLEEWASATATKEELDFWLINDPLPPLGSMGLRARFACLMGWIGQDTKKALDQLRNFRNIFAHEPIPPPLADCVEPLCRSMSDTARLLCERTLQDLGMGGKAPFSPRLILKLFSAGIMVDLFIAIGPTKESEL